MKCPFPFQKKQIRKKENFEQIPLYIEDYYMPIKDKNKEEPLHEDRGSIIIEIL